MTIRLPNRSNRIEDLPLQQQLDNLAKLSVPSGQWGFSQVLANATVTTITFNATAQDQWNMWDQAATFTVPYRGIYLFCIKGFHSTAAGTSRYNDILVSGGSIASMRWAPTGGSEFTHTVLHMVAKDARVQFRAWQDSGGASTMNGVMTLAWLGSLAL